MPCEEALPELSFTRFPRSSLTLLETVKVRSTNLDYCSHTNNSEYMRFIFNTYTAKDFLERVITGIEIHYGNQTFEGDEIAIFKHSDTQADYFSLVSNGKTSVDCFLLWK